MDASTSNNSRVVLSVPTKDLVAWLLGPNYAATCPLVPSVKELEALQPQAVLEAECADMAPLQQRITHGINREGAYVVKNKVGGSRLAGRAQSRVLQGIAAAVVMQQAACGSSSHRAMAWFVLRSRHCFAVPHV